MDKRLQYNGTPWTARIGDKVPVNYPNTRIHMRQIKRDDQKILVDEYCAPTPCPCMYTNGIILI